MVALSALKILPIVVSVLMAALAAVFTRTLSRKDGYRSIRCSILLSWRHSGFWVHDDFLHRTRPARAAHPEGEVARGMSTSSPQRAEPPAHSPPLQDELLCA